MLDKETVQWFFRGFLLTTFLLLAGLALLRPAIGWAQGGDTEGTNPNLAAADEQPSTDVRTDDPAGQNEVPVAADATLSDNNRTAGDIEAVASVTRTDDPLGRHQIPLADPGPAIPNTRAFDPNASTTVLSDLLAQDPAGNIGSQSYSSPLVIPAADFSSDGFDPDSFRFSFIGGYMTGQNVNNCQQAPAYLPAGAAVSNLFVSLYDNDAANDLALEVRRVNNFNGQSDTMASVKSTGASGTLKSLNDASIANPTIVYPDYSYYVTTCLASNQLRFYSVRIYYSGP